MPTTETINLANKILSQYNGPVSHHLMVYPVTMSNGQTYELTTILSLYLATHGDLTSGLKTVECPLTRETIQVDPENLHCNVSIKDTINTLLDSLNIKDIPNYTLLPENARVVDYMLKCVKIR